MEVIRSNVRPNHIRVLVSTPCYLSPDKIMQYFKGKSSYRLQREFPMLQKRYWGRHLWFRGYFSALSGAVSEAQIKQYMENQFDETDSFKVRDETEAEDSKLKSDSSESVQMTFSLTERSRS